jgi:hypothetical protein
MITTQEIETALKNAGAVIEEKIQSDTQYWTIYFGTNLYFSTTIDATIFLENLLYEIQMNECYFFKKQHIEYGTIDYGINELIEDLRLWL